MLDPLRSSLGKAVRFSRFRRDWRRLSLADRCLMFLFFLLLAQSAATLFMPYSPDGREIDIVVRTSSASVFGYLLGGGMARQNRVPEGEDMASPDLSQSPAQPAAEPYPTPGECNRFRVLAAAGAGIFCLCVLLLLRDWPGKTTQLSGSDSAAAVIVQFRDYISGSLGVLIGCASRSSGTSPD